MVGVAGRSKGCATCRKRKKGINKHQCDLQLPECGQCRTRGTVCGGYDMDRVFINKGYWPLAISSQVGNPVREPIHTASQGSKPCGDAASTQSSVLPTSLARSAFSERSMETVFDMYLPSGILKAGFSPTSGFASLLPRLISRENALRTAVLAIGLVALGKEKQNKEFIEQGRIFYGQALRELGVALQDPYRRRSEALLVVPQLLGLYEILFGTSTEEGKQAGNWMSHAQGELVLLLDRGPGAYNSDIAHILFKEARYSTIITAVRSRSATVLNDELWKTLPWRNRVKTPEDTLLDVLAEIPEILGNLDHLDFEPKEGDQGQYQVLRLEALAKCWKAHTYLESWIDANLEEVYSPEADEPIPIIFPNLKIALQSIRYWATATLLYQSLDRALRISDSSSHVSYSNRPHPRLFAHHIIRSISYLFEKDNGVPGATAVSFPLGVALLYMQQSDVQELDYMTMVYRSWNGPMLPSAIRDFLVSMRTATGLAEKKAPINRITWSTKEKSPVVSN